MICLIGIFITKASLSWAQLLLVIERSEIQGGSSVLWARGPDLACVWGGHDVRLPHFSLLRILSQTCSNILGAFWAAKADPTMFQRFGTFLSTINRSKILLQCGII